MDNEIYEPLNQFDADLRDLMMDCITEKDSNITHVTRHTTTVSYIF